MENHAVELRDSLTYARAFEQSVDLFVANCRQLLDESIELAANVHSTLQWVRLCAVLGTALNEIIQEHARPPPVTDQPISPVDVESCADSDSLHIPSSSPEKPGADENLPARAGESSTVMPKLRVRLKNAAKQRKFHRKALPPEQRYIARQFGLPPSRSCVRPANRRGKAKGRPGRPLVVIKPTPCPYCGKVFTLKRQFDLHVRKHEREFEEATCAICNYRAKDKRTLGKHLTDVHPLPKPADTMFVCNICNAKYRKTRPFQKHMAAHAVESNFACPLCDYRGKSKVLLRFHKRTHNVPVLPCKFEGCSMLFKTSGYQRSHYKRVHLNERGPEKMCDLCGKSVSAYDLRRHMEAHATQERRGCYCAICGLRLKNKSCLQMHISQDHIRVERLPQLTFTCKICNAKYLYAKHFRKHMAAHEVESNFQCPFCKYRAKSKLLLRMHKRTHNDRVLPCEFEGCSMLFKTRHSLREHAKKVHLKLRPKMCDVCGKRFPDSKNLATHMLTHEGARPYMCYVCGRSFSQFNNMKYHVRSIHKVEFDTSLTPSNTAYRVFEFPAGHPKPAKRSVAAPANPASSSGANKVKERISRNCEVCGRRCADLKELRQHMRSHDGEKPFMCYICGRTFSRFNNMKHHVINIHKAEFDPLVTRWNAAYKVYDIGASQQSKPNTRSSRSARAAAHSSRRSKPPNQTSPNLANQASSSSGLATPDASSRSANQASSSSLRLAAADEPDYLPSGELNAGEPVASTSNGNRSTFSDLSHQTAASNAAPFLLTDQSIFGHMDYFDPLSMRNQPNMFAGEHWPAQ